MEKLYLHNSMVINKKLTAQRNITNILKNIIKSRGKPSTKYIFIIKYCIVPKKDWMNDGRITVIGRKQKNCSAFCNSDQKKDTKTRWKKSFRKLDLLVTKRNKTLSSAESSFKGSIGQKETTRDPRGEALIGWVFRRHGPCSPRCGLDGAAGPARPPPASPWEKI